MDLCRIEGFVVAEAAVDMLVAEKQMVVAILMVERRDSKRHVRCKAAVVDPGRWWTLENIPELP